MDPSPLGSPAGSDGVSGVDTNALDEALAESPIERLTRLKREKRLLARQQRNAGRRPAEVALLTAQKYVSFATLAGKIPDAAAYLASIKEPSLVLGVAPGLEYLGPRYFDVRSEEGKEILAALDAKRAVADAVQPMEAEDIVAAVEPGDSLAAAAPAPAAVTETVLAAAAPAPAVVTETVLRPSQASQDDDDEAVNRWRRLVDEHPTTWRDRLGPEGARRWTGEEECPPWDLAKPPRATNRYWCGALPPGVTKRHDISFANHCKGHPALEEAWRDAVKLSKAAKETCEAERKAYEECLALSRANGQNSGRATTRKAYADQDAHATEQRAATEKDIEEDKETFDILSITCMKYQVAKDDDILKALAAANGGLHWSALFKLDENGRRQFVSALARSNLPHIQGILERTHLDHVDGGWKNEQQAIWEMLIRGLIDEVLNKRLPGIEWFLAHRLERWFFDTSYIKGALCFDRGYGAAFTTVFEIEKDWDWFGMPIKDRQKKELYFIRRDLLYNIVRAVGVEVDDRVEVEFQSAWYPAVVEAVNDDGTFEILYDTDETESRVPAASVRKINSLTGWDAIRFFLLKQRYPDLTFKHAPSSRSGGNYGGHFWARFLNRGVVEMVVDHVGLATFRGEDGKWYRRVGVRGLLPQDVNFYASGYEWMTVLDLEDYVRHYLANALYKKGIGRVGYRPDFFKRK